MAKQCWPIGEVAKRTGIPTKTVRFYADQGVVPPSGRSRSGYRLYTETDIAKLDLVRTLRDAGLGLDAIRAVLARDMTLAEALRLRLKAIEAHILSLRQVAAALRAALTSEPGEPDLRRLTTVTRLSHEERKAVIERFYQQVSEGIPIDEKWMESKIEASAPKLPDDPTPEQLDAWIELAEIVSDPTFVESLRQNAKEVWTHGLDVQRLQTLNQETGRAAMQARAKKTPIQSADAKLIVERYLDGVAELAGKDPRDADFRAGVRTRFERQDPRASRYWELVAVLNGRHAMSNYTADWKWMVEAILHHLAA